MFEGFKKFILRGNVLDLAVGVIIGAAFTAIVNSLVTDLITPVFGIFGGIPDFSALTFTVNSSQFNIGNFVNVVITFVLTAAVLYWFIILPANRLMDLRKVEEDPETRTVKCPECRSSIPQLARRCPFCTTILVPSELTTPEMANPDAAQTAGVAASAPSRATTAQTAPAATAT